jgi:hypothetical protein
MPVDGLRRAVLLARVDLPLGHTGTSDHVLPRMDFGRSSAFKLKERWLPSYPALVNRLRDNMVSIGGQLPEARSKQGSEQHIVLQFADQRA